MVFCVSIFGILFDCFVYTKMHKPMWKHWQREKNRNRLGLKVYRNFFWWVYDFFFGLSFSVCSFHTIESSWKCNVLESNETSQQVNKQPNQQTNPPQKTSNIYPDVFNAIRFVALIGYYAMELLCKPIETKPHDRQQTAVERGRTMRRYISNHLKCQIVA